MANPGKPTRELLVRLLQQPSSEDTTRPQKPASDLDNGVTKVSLTRKAIAIVIAFTAIQLIVPFFLYGLSIEAENEVASEARERKILGKSDLLTKVCLSDLPDSLESYVFATSDTAKVTELENYTKAKKTVQRERLTGFRKTSKTRKRK